MTASVWGCETGGTIISCPYRKDAARTTRLKWRLTLEGSSDQQSLGVLLGNHQKFEGCLTRPAGALLPTSHGVRAYGQVGSEKSLAGLQRLADAPNLFQWKPPWSRGECGDALIHGDRAP